MDSGIIHVFFSMNRRSSGIEIVMGDSRLLSNIREVNWEGLEIKTKNPIGRGKSFEISFSEIFNLGVFATRTFPKNVFVTSYYTTDDKVESYMDDYAIILPGKIEKNGYFPAQQFDDVKGKRYYGNLLNHAEHGHANCTFTMHTIASQKHIMIKTKRIIAKGEQLLIDYYELVNTSSFF